MLKNLRGLLKYRQLIQSMVARELKARYRGSVLGFFWSFINPLLLLLVYTFVFSYVLPARQPNLDPYALFLFCGILPWTWFSSSILESANVLISGGNLLKKVMFPAEVLPFVTVPPYKIGSGHGPTGSRRSCVPGSNSPTRPRWPPAA